MADQWEKILLTTINSISVFVGSCANVLIIISFFFFTPVKEATERFLVSLSVADFLTCAIGQTGLIFHINEAVTSGLDLILKVLPSGIMTASLHGLLAVTVDRFVSIYLPFKYVYWMNDRNVRLIILASWIPSLIGPILFNTEVMIVINIIVAYRAVIFLLVPSLYIIIYREARKQARRIKDASSPSVAGFRSTNKATKGVGLVLATTVVSWLPFIVFPGLAFNILGMTLADINREIQWCLSFACLNSCINPFLYYWRFSKFRRSIRKMIQSLGRHIGIAERRHLQRTERQTPIAQNDTSQTRRKSAWPVAENVQSDNELRNS